MTQDPKTVAFFLITIWAAALLWVVARGASYCFGVGAKHVSIGFGPFLLLAVGAIVPPLMFVACALFLFRFKPKKRLLRLREVAINELNLEKVLDLAASDIHIRARARGRSDWYTLHWKNVSEVRRLRWIRRHKTAILDGLREKAKISASGKRIVVDWLDVFETASQA